MRYVSKIHTLPMGGQSEYGVAYGKTRRIPRFAAQFHRTTKIKVGSVVSDIETHNLVSSGDFTGYKRMQLRGSNGLEQGIIFVQDDAGPMSLLSIVAEQNTNA
jgi:hypothetical protein